MPRGRKNLQEVDKTKPNAIKKEIKNFKKRKYTMRNLKNVKWQHWPSFDVLPIVYFFVQLVLSALSTHTFPWLVIVKALWTLAGRSLSLPMRRVMPNSSSRTAEGSWASSFSWGCKWSASKVLDGSRNLKRTKDNKCQHTHCYMQWRKCDAAVLLFSGSDLPVQENLDVLKKKNTL